MIINLKPQKAIKIFRYSLLTNRYLGCIMCQTSRKGGGNRGGFRQFLLNTTYSGRNEGDFVQTETSLKSNEVSLWDFMKSNGAFLWDFSSCLLSGQSQFHFRARSPASCSAGDFGLRIFLKPAKLFVTAEERYGDKGRRTFQLLKK